MWRISGQVGIDMGDAGFEWQDFPTFFVEAGFQERSLALAKASVILAGGPINRISISGLTLEYVGVPVDFR